MKYYILKRLNSKLLNDYLCEFDKAKRETIEKRTSTKHDLLLVEKTSKNNAETYTNLWTINEGCDSHLKYIGKNRMYDYTGIVFPLVHENGDIRFFSDLLKK